MSRTEWSHWKELCEFLAKRPGRSAKKTLIPDHLSYLLMGKSMQRRKELDVIFYARGWGWRLRSDWQDRLGKFDS